MVGRRPTKPLHLALVDGYAECHPDRMANRSDPENNGPIGESPDWFTDHEDEVFRDIVARVWWVRASDYHMVVFASLIYAAQVESSIAGRGMLDMKDVNAFIGIMTRLGATPTSRNHIQLPNDQKGKGRFK